jgi:hypothetical protein
MTKKSVWETLSKINVNDHTEKKNGLTYLSWAWAWGVLKEHYPEATFEKHIQDNGMPYIMDANGFAYVQVTVTVDGISATELFPVLDYKNKAVVKPDSFAINTAMQRALAKAISYHGLGHYIYAGEDLPQGEDASQSHGEARQKPGQHREVVAQPKAQVAAVPPSEEPTPPVKDADGNQHPTAGWDKVADTLCEVVRHFSGTEEDLKRIWSTNVGVINQLKTFAPSLHEQVVTVFKKRKAEVQGEAA